MNHIKISAIIACYKDEKAIPIMHDRLTSVFKKIPVTYELIFVNDGSPDHSESVLKNIVQKDNHTIAVNHSRNFGSQMAFTSGMDISTGDAIVFLDGDLQDPPEMIEKFFRKWKEGYDVVYGIREKRETSFFMQHAYKVFYRLFRRMSYISIPLDAGNFSLIDRRVVEVLKTFPERDRFLRGLRAWVGFRQTGIGYVRQERMFGRTTNSLLRNFDWAKRGIFSFSYVPLQIMTVLSLCAFALSVFAMVLQILLRILLPDSAPKGATTILTAILFIGSIQLLGISVLGEYIGKIFEEVKQRPKYVVKSIFKK